MGIVVLIGFIFGTICVGRLLFTCHLVDCGIVKLTDEKYFGAEGWTRLQQVLEGTNDEVLSRLYKRLFPQLRRDFNGSMFDGTSLDGERAAIRPAHQSAVRDFFCAHDVRRKQQTLRLWRYDSSFIPVETISAIHENFLAKEDDGKKREDGAYYTPRLLAETTLDLPLERRPGLAGKRFLDPSCGSGIFLVLLFNRLAAEWTAKQTEDGKKFYLPRQRPRPSAGSGPSGHSAGSGPSGFQPTPAIFVPDLRTGVSSTATTSGRSGGNCESSEECSELKSKSLSTRPIE